MMEVSGSERIWMNSASNWCASHPLAVPKTALEMRKRGRSHEAIDRLIYQNPLKFLSQCAKFKIPNT